MWGVKLVESGVGGVFGVVLVTGGKWGAGCGACEGRKMTWVGCGEYGWKVEWVGCGVWCLRREESGEGGV